jgi:hypothetical protein
VRADLSKITLSLGVVVALGILTAALPARAPLLELDSCHDDLDRLRRTASDASDAAEDAKSKADDFDDCRRDPELHDLLGDGCRSRRSDYESALSDLESKMDDLDSHLQSVQSSCGYEFTINRMSAVEASQRRLEASKRRLCASLKELVSLGMPPDKALQMCKANADEQLCKACLGLK